VSAVMRPTFRRNEDRPLGAGLLHDEGDQIWRDRQSRVQDHPNAARKSTALVRMRGASLNFAFIVAANASKTLKRVAT
jgi:hypothetical protein